MLEKSETKVIVVRNSCLWRFILALNIAAMPAVYYIINEAIELQKEEPIYHEYVGLMYITAAVALLSGVGLALMELKVLLSPYSFEEIESTEE